MSKKYIIRNHRFVNKESLTASALLIFSKEVCEAYKKVNMFKIDKRKKKRKMRKMLKHIVPCTFKL